MSGLGLLTEYERGAERLKGVSVSPWLDDLIRQYRHPQPPRRRGWLVVAAFLALAAIVSPWLLRLDAAAYPSEPERRQALDLCSREDPTFVRFLPGDREGCYRLFANRHIAQ